MSFDLKQLSQTYYKQLFQSLWNRAMSFDRRILLRSNAKTVSIPLEQGNVFRQNILGKSAKEIESQSLWSRAMSFDKGFFKRLHDKRQSQSLWSRAMSFDINFKHFRKRNWSQSLWSRAMSFDAYAMRAELSAIQSQSLWNRAMSFDSVQRLNTCVQNSLNPFGTGQCLSTVRQSERWNNENVSIPLEQGNVFRRSLVFQEQR